MSSSFTIMIDETQRVALLDLLVATNLGGNSNSDHALAYWQSMLIELPENEAETPNAIHGFCL